MYDYSNTFKLRALPSQTNYNKWANVSTRFNNSGKRTSTVNLLGLSLLTIDRFMVKVDVQNHISIKII